MGRASERDKFRQKNADRRLALKTIQRYLFREARDRRRYGTGPTRGAFGRAPAVVFNELAVGTLGERRQERRQKTESDR